jgi:cytochrome c biogenesis protein CcdA
MELLVGTSLLAAFVAGIAALFAPCCITVLLPSYFGSIFREKYKVFLMTFLFFLGILTVFLPLGLGFAALGQAFSRYHNVIFSVGGIFLFILGVTMLSGKSFSLPFTVHPTLKKHNAGSVFVLGIFSGIATTCCAPVLAGVMALSTMAGSLFWGVMYTVSYVLGMVTPLFLIALFLDRYDVTGRLNKINSSVTYGFAGSKVQLTIAQLISGVVFVLMGLSTVYLAFSNKLFVHSAYQTGINITLTQILKEANRYIGFVPQWGWGLLVIIAIAGIVRTAIKQLNKEKNK